jgi:hypothetical protein
MVSLNFAEMTNEQRRQLVDTQQTYSVWRAANLELEALGGMTISKSAGRQYVYETRGPVRTSLGRATPELLKKKADHSAKRKALSARVKSIRMRLEQMAPVNRAVQLGRMRGIVARIIREIDREGLLGDHVIVGGTNALHAYEVVCGVIINQDHVATTDADLIWDGDQNLFLAAKGVKREGLMGLLRRVDSSFVAAYGMNATNKDGFIVDLICPDTDEQPAIREGGDLIATPMPGIAWLFLAPRLEQVVVGEDGMPVRMVVPEARTFALHKLWVSRQPSRQIPKRRRDHSHAVLVAELVRTYMGQKFTQKVMPWLPKELRSLTKELSKARLDAS